MTARLLVQKVSQAGSDDVSSLFVARGLYQSLFVWQGPKTDVYTRKSKKSCTSMC